MFVGMIVCKCESVNMRACEAMTVCVCEHVYLLMSGSVHVWIGELVDL